MGLSFLHVYSVAKGTGNDDIGKNFLYVPFVASSNDDSISSTLIVMCHVHAIVWCYNGAYLSAVFGCARCVNVAIPEEPRQPRQPPLFLLTGGCWGQVELGVLVRFPIQNMYPTAISRRGSDYGAACHGQPNGKFYSRQPSPKTPGLEPNAA
jgi:hypothetical protein